MSGVLIVAEQRRGELRPQSAELITAAQGVRRAGDAVSIAIIGAAPDAFIPSLSLAGVDVATIEVPLETWPRSSSPPPWGVLEPTPLPCGLLRPWQDAAAEYMKLIDPRPEAQE